MTLQELEENEIWLSQYGYRLYFKEFCYYLCVPEWDRLIPIGNILDFSFAYVKACFESSVELDCIKLYSNGWEL